MTSMTVGRYGALMLPAEIKDRYQLTPETSIRIIETRTGILLVPLTDVPMSAELTLELQEWQSLSQETWDLFSYEEDEVA